MGVAHIRLIMVEHNAELSEPKQPLPVIQIPQKRMQSDDAKSKEPEDADEPWICRGRD